MFVVIVFAPVISILITMTSIYSVHIVLGPLLSDSFTSSTISTLLIIFGFVLRYRGVLSHVLKMNGAKHTRKYKIHIMKKTTSKSKIKKLRENL